MPGVVTYKKKGKIAQKDASKNKRKGQLFTAKNQKQEVYDHSDNSNEGEEEQEHEEFDGVEIGSDSGSDILSDGDDPLPDDFIGGSDNEGIVFYSRLMFCLFYFFWLKTFWV